MRKDRSNGNITFSPSDLINYVNEGEFSSWMERARIENYQQFDCLKDPEDETLEALRQKGHEHEEAFLKQLIKKYPNYIIIEGTDDIKLKAHLTEKAMKEGADLIYQAQQSKGEFAGSIDFLIKKDGMKSRFGNYYYVPYNTKLFTLSN